MRGNVISREQREHRSCGRRACSESDVYGRTACIATKEATKVSAVYTFLARYAVHTQPVSIVEELLKVGFEVHDEGKLSPVDVEELSHAKPNG